MSRHLRAARMCGARFKIYFAEQEAASRVREVFIDKGLGDIAVGVLPPSRPKQRVRR